MNHKNYTVSHKEVQKMTREFMRSRGYKVVTDKYYQSTANSKDGVVSPVSVAGRRGGRYDDVFAAPGGEEIVCEYKPTPVTSSEVLRGIGQTINYSVESGMRCYLVISQAEYHRFATTLDKCSWLGLFIYTNRVIVNWRRPIDLSLLPAPNEIQEVG